MAGQQWEVEPGEVLGSLGWPSPLASVDISLKWVMMLPHGLSGSNDIVCEELEP